MDHQPQFQHKQVKHKQRIDWIVLGFMVAVHLIALSGFYWFSIAAFVAFVLFYAVTALGITLGFHRYFTHRSFKAPRFVEIILATMGSLAMQGSVLEWVGHHRMHHAHSDTGKDPHNASRGFWYSHIGWLFRITPEFDDARNLHRFARDIARDRVLMFMSQQWFLLTLQVVLGILLYWGLGMPGVIWGIFCRLVFVYHVTWLVNSASHKWGYRNFNVKDLAKNNWLAGILAFGEGWHNNHHAFSDAANTGYRWWELDLTWQCIKILRALGWASQVKVVDYRKLYLT